MAKPTTEVDLTGFGYQSLEHVGKGQYASAALVQDMATGTKYVAKCISLAALNDHDQDLANQEVILLQSLSNPYIVAYRDSFLIEGSNTLVIVMEYCSGGDLRKLIKEKAKSGAHFPEDQIMTWFVQLCLALQVCHQEKVLHRDLKTSNIFIVEGSHTVKLGDFGISRILEATHEAAVTIVGTPYYMSPEVCRSEPYNWKSDIWALGCVLYELCMLRHAFESSSLMGLVYKIVSDHYEPIPAQYSSELNDLIRQLLHKNAEERPSINQVFAIPFVKEYLAREAPILVAPEPRSPAPPPPPRPRGAASLQPKQEKPKPPSPRPKAPPPPPQGSPPLTPQSAVLIIASRIRRRLVEQRLNWLCTFASFDSEGAGNLSSDELCRALSSLRLGINEGEIVSLVESLIPSPGAKISLDAFSSCVRDVPLEVKQYEAWARQTLAGPGAKVNELLVSRDGARQGTISDDAFRATMRELVPTLTEQDLNLMVLLSNKGALGDIDYVEFVSVFCAPAVASTQFAPGPPGMPPLSVGAPLAPPGMPPLPGTAPVPGANLGMTLTLNDVNDMSFYSCASKTAS